MNQPQSNANDMKEYIIKVMEVMVEIFVNVVATILQNLLYIRAVRYHLKFCVISLIISYEQKES